MVQLLEALKFKTPLRLLPVRSSLDVGLPTHSEGSVGGDLQGEDVFTFPLLDDRLRAEIRARHAAGQRVFRGEDWSQQDLSGLDLSGCDLREVNLFGASLRGTNLARADLQGANCHRVNFRHANLEGTVCTGVAFNNCLFERARIVKANWVGATVLNGRFQQTLWHANRIAAERFSPNGIGLYGVLDERGMEENCRKVEWKRRKAIIAAFCLALCGLTQLLAFIIPQR